MCDADFIIRPPPPQRESPFDLPPPRPPSPEIERSSRSCSQSKESFTLNALAEFRYTEKALPELLPFPFKAEVSNERPRSSGTAPKPSKFVKGSMYHSDYESDLDGPIPAKWRSYNSDTDEGNHVLKYRKVKPKLPCRNNQLTTERNPSPPCPHKWESHEEIEKLEEKLRKKKSDFLAEVALLKSSKLSNQLDTEVTRNTIINETKSITRNTTTNESKGETISMSANSWHESKHAKPLPLPINEKRGLNPPNDKAPQFESVNFQTYDNGDGTRQHVLDISNYVESPTTPATTSNVDKHERISNPIKDDKQSDLYTTRTSESHLQVENKVNSVKSLSRSNLEPVPREKTKKVESITNICDAFVDGNKKNDHLFRESPHFKLSSKEPFQIKSPERSSQAISGFSNPQMEQLTSPNPPPLPIKTRHNDIAPMQPLSSQQTLSPNIMESSSISDEQSQCSQSTVRCVIREEFVSVKEKIKILEQKVEEQDNMENEIENETFADDTIDAISSSERQTPTTPTTPRIKPYDIPGAVRILPPAASSPITCKSNSSTIRKGRRSNSVDQYSTSLRASPILSPIRAPRSAQPSPISGVSSFFPKMSTDCSTNQTMHLNQNTDYKCKVLEAHNNQSEGKENDGQDMEKLKAFKEKLIQGNISADIPGTKTEIASNATQKESKVPNVTCENYTNIASPKELSETSPPRPPLPEDIEHYPLTHSSSGEQLQHTFRYTSDTEFATSSMTECAYTECSSLERQSATGRESKGALKAENTFAYKNNILEDTNKIFGIDPISDSGLESETNKNSLSIEGTFSKKRQSRSPFQLTQATEQQHLKRSPKLSRAATRSSMKDCSRLDADGYEADTDDTLSRAKRRSVKDIAKSFQQAENACPSPLPFRPRPSFLHDGSDYEASDFEYQPR